MEMRSQHRKHRVVGAWAQNVVADAARALSARREQGEIPPTGTHDRTAEPHGFFPDNAERCARCSTVKDPANVLPHCLTYSHCFSLLLRSLREGFQNPAVELHWKQHLDTHIPDAETRDGLVAAINLGALA